MPFRDGNECLLQILSEKFEKSEVRTWKTSKRTTTGENASGTVSENYPGEYPLNSGFMPLRKFKIIFVDKSMCI